MKQIPSSVGIVAVAFAACGFGGLWAYSLHKHHAKPPAESDTMGDAPEAGLAEPGPPPGSDPRYTGGEDLTRTIDEWNSKEFDSPWHTPVSGTARRVANHSVRRV